MRPVHRCLCYATEMAPREVLAPSSLPLQGSACAISAIEAKLVRPARVELARRRHSLLGTACLPIPPRAYGADPRTCTEKQLGLSQPGLLIPFRSASWCQAPDSHREAVRFELTRYANSRQLGGTHGRTRTDTSRFRKSASAPSAWVWRPELDSNQHRRLRRPSTGPSAGASLERADGVEPSRASLATMPRTMRARMLGSCRRICTCYLRLIRSVLISMSFAAELVRTAGLAPAASEFQARLSAADLRPELDTPTGVAPA